MSEEQDFLSAIEPTNIILYENSTTQWLRPHHVSLVINASIICVGILAQLLLLYVIFKNRRLQGRTNIAIANWIALELCTHNILFPLEHVLNAQDVSFTARMICADLWLLCYNFCLVFLHVLLVDSIMCSESSNDTSDPKFGKFVEKVYGTLVALMTVVISWKMLTFNGYIEALLLIAVTINILVLFIRYVHKLSLRLFGKRGHCDKNAGDLRLHVVTLFFVAHSLIISLFIISIVYKSSLLSYFASFWHLSGVYVIGLLILNDKHFKSALKASLKLNRPDTQDNS